jgi:hypothetical protein
MGEFSKWLLHENQKELFDYLFAIVLNAVFLGLIALILWPMGRAMLAFRLAKGYWYFWSVLIVIAALLVLVQRIFRMDLYSHPSAYVNSGLAVSGFVQVGWSAFAALVISGAVTNASVVVMIVLYAVGVVSSYVASVVVGAFFMGSIYRMVNMILAAVSFILFSIWPGAGGAIYGWFFNFIDTIAWSPLIFRCSLLL